MKKWLFLFLIFFIFFSCKEVNNDQPNLSKWLISLIERDIDPDFEIKNDKTLNDSIQLKYKLNNAIQWLKPRQKGIQLFHNNKIGLGLLKNSHGIHLVSLYDIRRGIELLNKSNTSIFRINLSNGKNIIKLSNESGWDTIKIQWKSENKNPKLSLLFLNPLDVNLKGLSLICEIEFENNFTNWTLESLLPKKGLSLLESEFPSILAGPIGKNSQDNVLHYPKASGVASQNPFANVIDYSEMYPNWRATYQMLGLYNKQGGLYIACHDPTGSIKTISTYSDEKKVGFRFNWPAPNMGLAGNDYKLPGKAVIGYVAGGWYEAAMIYKSWIKKEAPWWPPAPSKRPSRINDVAVWIQHESSGDLSTLVEEVIEFAEYMRVPIGFHWYVWHKIPFDDNYPNFFPAKEGFLQAVRKLENEGIRVMPYINGRLWDADLEDFKIEGIKAVTKNQKGEPYIENYGNGVRNAVMDPTTQIWQKKIKEIVLKLQHEIGVSGVYIDQIAAAEPKLCMDTLHGHPIGGGSWWLDKGYYKLLSNIRDDMPSGAFLTSESMAEPYIHLLDGILSWNSQFQDQKPIYSAIYGGRISIFGRYNPVGPNKHKALIMRAGQQLVFGEQLGWISPKILNEKKPADFLRKMAQTRHKLIDYFIGGKMLAPPIVYGDIPNITADWEWGENNQSDISLSALQKGTWKSENGRVVKIFVNISDEKINFEVLDLETEKLNKLSIDAFDIIIFEET